MQFDSVRVDVPAVEAAVHEVGPHEVMAGIVLSRVMEVAEVPTMV
jgi:hypothetical protein